MDPETSFNLEMRIICTNVRSCGFSFDKVVDADTTNFKDLVDDIVGKYPPDYGEVVKYSSCTISVLIQNQTFKSQQTMT